jgi:hypothetical protein
LRLINEYSKSYASIQKSGLCEFNANRVHNPFFALIHLHYDLDQLGLHKDWVCSIFPDANTEMYWWPTIVYSSYSQAMAHCGETLSLYATEIMFKIVIDEHKRNFAPGTTAPPSLATMPQLLGFKDKLVGVHRTSKHIYLSTNSYITGDTFSLPAHTFELGLEQMRCLIGCNATIATQVDHVLKSTKYVQSEEDGGHKQLEEDGRHKQLEADGGCKQLEADGGHWRQMEDRSSWRQMKDASSWRQMEDMSSWRQVEDMSSWRQMEVDGGCKQLEADGGRKQLEADGGCEQLEADGGHKQLEADGGLKLKHLEAD